MKKIGTLNTHLSRVIAGMGHTDGLVVCDSGLPIPRDKQVVDLALTTNVPRFMDAVKVILSELQVERAVVATEMVNGANGLMSALEEVLPGVPIESVSHADFKRLTADQSVSAIVRTGEATPYANVLLVSGVTFG
jgi:D-ribose pyranase